MKKNSSLLALSILCLGCLSILLIAPFIGMDILSPQQIMHNDLTRTIFYFLRVPRVIMAFLAGSGLAVCGLIFQAMFRNPLADPFNLGISSGASCGAAIMILLGLQGTILGLPFISLGAFSGAALAMILVYLLSSLQKTSSSLTMLLSGIAISLLFSSVLMLAQYLSSSRESFQIVRWLMGGIEIYGYQSILSTLPFFIIGIIIIFLLLPQLDQLLVGEDNAKSRGVRVSRLNKLLLFAATIIVGSIVSVCGPIGFIGLITPHVCKMFFKNNHRILGPATFLCGGTFLVFCDTFARVVIAPAEMPVGVITALLGGPFFLWLLFFKKGRIASLNE